MECDCGYACAGATEDEIVEDARRHARDAHGIDVTSAQVRQVVGWLRSPADAT